MKGAITLPEEVANPDNIPLEVTIGVTVRGASANDYSHNWKTSYEWSEDGRSCTAIRVCTMDASHTETARAAVSSQVSKAADCTKAGETLYTAIFAEDWAHRQTKTVANIPATGHKLTRTGGKAACCAEAGNIEYWTCEGCGKVFGDKDGMKEITLESTTVLAADHHYVKLREWQMQSLWRFLSHNHKQDRSATNRRHWPSAAVGWRAACIRHDPGCFGSHRLETQQLERGALQLI